MIKKLFLFDLLLLFFSIESFGETSKLYELLYRKRKLQVQLSYILVRQDEILQKKFSQKNNQKLILENIDSNSDEATNLFIQFKKTSEKDKKLRYLLKKSIEASLISYNRNRQSLEQSLHSFLGLSYHKERNLDLLKDFSSMKADLQKKIDFLEKKIQEDNELYKSWSNLKNIYNSFSNCEEFKMHPGVIQGSKFFHRCRGEISLNKSAEIVFEDPNLLGGVLIAEHAGELFSVFRGIQRVQKSKKITPKVPFAEVKNKKFSYHLRFKDQDLKF